MCIVRQESTVLIDMNTILYVIVPLSVELVEVFIYNDQHCLIGQSRTDDQGNFSVPIKRDIKMHIFLTKRSVHCVSDRTNETDCTRRARSNNKTKLFQGA